MDPRDDQPDRHEIGRRVYLVADVEPLDLDGVRTVAVGTGLWLLAFLGMLPFWSPLQESGRLWWVWTCMAGVSLGLFGVEYCRRRRTARESRADATDRTDVTAGTEGTAGDEQPPRGPGRAEAPRPPRAPKGGRRRA